MLFEVSLFIESKKSLKEKVIYLFIFIIIFRINFIHFLRVLIKYIYCGEFEISLNVYFILHQMEVSENIK